MQAKVHPCDEDGVWKDPETRESYDKLSPILQHMFQVLRAKCAENGVILIFLEGFRTHERQAELYKKRDLKTGEFLTVFPPGTSMHEYGLAFDCCVWRESDGTLFTNQDNEGHTEVMQCVANIAKKTPQTKHLLWGGTWKEFVDIPHFFLPPNIYTDMKVQEYITMKERT